MIAIIASIVVPAVIYLFLRPLVEKKYSLAKKYRVPLIVGSVVYFFAWYLPSPVIDGLDTGFWTHFAGGIAAGFFWLYLIKSGVWKVKGVGAELVLLYALVSSLGVLNELAEFALYKVNLFPSVADTSWDLVANTLGAAVFYAAFKIVTSLRK